MLLMPLEANDSSPAMVKPGIRLAPISQIVSCWAHLLVLLQSALQLLVALAQPCMLLLLRVKLLHGQRLFRSTTVKLLHGQSFFKSFPARHARRPSIH